MFCFVLQRTPTNENNGGTERRGIQQLLKQNEQGPKDHIENQLEIPGLEILTLDFPNDKYINHNLRQ